jgi:hypothetical protein
MAQMNTDKTRKMKQKITKETNCDRKSSETEGKPEGGNSVK